MTGTAKLVAIKAKDLSSGYRYLGIAEILTKSKRHDEALDWAERGLRAFPDCPQDGLRDFLVAAYLKRKRNDEALQLTWIQFEERPGLEPPTRNYTRSPASSASGRRSASVHWPGSIMRSPRRLHPPTAGSPSHRRPITPCGCRLLYGRRIWMLPGQRSTKASATLPC